MPISLAFDASYWVSFFFPGVEFRFVDYCSVSEKGISDGWIVEREYRMGDSLFS